MAVCVAVINGKEKLITLIRSSISRFPRWHSSLAFFIAPFLCMYTQLNGFSVFKATPLIVQLSLPSQWTLVAFPAEAVIRR